MKAIVSHNSFSQLLTEGERINRENVASFVKAAQHSREIVKIITTAFRLLLKQKIGTEHPYSWLGVFDEDELNEFIDEVMLVYRSIDLHEKAWDELEAIIHEWQESALAIANPDLEAAFSQKSGELEEVSLSEPIDENAV